MKKRIMAHSNEAIENLKLLIIDFANEEAKKIVDSAKTEAEAESAQIAKQADKAHAGIKKNIDSYFDKATDSIVTAILGEDTTPLPAQKKKKYASDGKHVS